MLAEGLRGFGAIVSCSQTSSNITVNDPAGGSNLLISTNGLGAIPLPGLSKTVWNATVYYEREDWSARIATRARSKYIREIANLSIDRTFQYVIGEQITDCQAGYEWQGELLKGFTVLFQVNNLTNAPYVSYQQSEARIIDYPTSDKQFLFSINYKLQAVPQALDERIRWHRARGARNDLRGRCAAEVHFWRPVRRRLPCRGAGCIND